MQSSESDSTLDPIGFKFGGEARKIFSEWHRKTRNREIADPALRAHVDKYPALFARLSLVHWIMRHPEKAPSHLEIDGKTACAVRDFIDNYLEPHTCKIYGHMSDHPGAEGGRRIARWILQHGHDRFLAGEITKNKWPGLATQEDIAPALEFLQAFG